MSHDGRICHIYGWVSESESLGQLEFTKNMIMSHDGMICHIWV